MSVSNFEFVASLGNSKKRKFGQVSLVRDRDSGEQYVLKTAFKQDLSERALLQVRNEQSFTFDHSNLPKIAFIHEDSEAISTLFNFKQGVDLWNYWQKVSSKKRLEFIHQLLEKFLPILDVIHAQQVFHCDIKPGNILIEEHADKSDFSVHLIDFGMAFNKSDEKSWNKQLIFPLGYAAPELILNQPLFIQASTDFFSLGITIFQLWTGQLPLLHKNPSIYTNLQLAHPIPSHPSMSKSLNEWIQKVCAKPLWRTAPNLLSEQEIHQTMSSNLEVRFKTSEELLEAFQLVKDKKRFLFF